MYIDYYVISTKMFFSSGATVMSWKKHRLSVQTCCFSDLFGVPYSDPMFPQFYFFLLFTIGHVDKKQIKKNFFPNRP